MSSMSVFFCIIFFGPDIGLRHKETTETLKKFFNYFEMGGSKYIWRFKKLTCTHAGGFKGNLFRLQFLCFFA